MKSERGNAAAMCEALKTIHDKVNSLDEECGVDPVEVRDIARAALSAPPRQCDVGTPEEQTVRMLNEYCQKYECLVYEHGVERRQCPLYHSGIDCRLIWAQKSYEQKGAEQ